MMPMMIQCHPELDKRLRTYLGSNANEARMRMADVPDGAELIDDQRLGFPSIKCENVYILPGIPEILEQKFQSLADRFSAEPYHLRMVFTRDGEGSIAEHLNATVAKFPALMLGSYPKLGDPEYSVKLTLERTRSCPLFTAGLGEFDSITTSPMLSTT